MRARWSGVRGRKFTQRRLAMAVCRRDGGVGEGVESVRTEVSDVYRVAIDCWWAKGAVNRRS
jgi:hypothetical protein